MIKSFFPAKRNLSVSLPLHIRSSSYKLLQLQLGAMEKLTAPGQAERPSEPAATPLNTSAYAQLLDTLRSSFDSHLLDSDLSIHSYNNQIQSASMADRFPSLEDFSEGM